MPRDPRFLSSTVRPTPRGWAVVALAVCASLVAGEAAGQAMHLQPVSHAASPTTDTLLVVTHTAPANRPRHIFDDRDVILRIDGSTLYIRSATRDEEVPLGDRTIGDLATHINNRYPGVRFTTDRPTAHVRELARGTAVRLVAGTQSVVKRRESIAELSTAASIAYTPVDTPPDESASLLRSAGVELDLVATKPFQYLVVRTRIGFGTAQPVPTQGDELEGEQATSPAEEAGVYPQGDIGSVVRLAQALTAGMYVDALVEPLSTDQFSVSLGGELSAMWAAPPSFVFPEIRLAEGFGPVESGFAADQIAEARRDLDGIVPLAMIAGGIRLTFGEPADPVFYTTVDLGRRQFLRRNFSVDYRFTPPTDTTGTIRTPEALETDVETPWEAIMRLTLGMRVSSKVALRVDFVHPLRERPIPEDAWRRGEGGADSERARPMLRLAISTPDLRFGK